MNISVIKFLKNELLMFSAVFVLSVVVLSSSLFFYNEKIIQRQASKQELLNIKRIYRVGLEHKKIFKENKHAYEGLVNNGFVSKENRLDWVSRMDDISKIYEIPKVKYNIEKQKPLGNNGVSIFYPNITIYKSVMNLDMTLLHEVDLLNFMDDLDAGVKGVFDVYACDLKRNYIDINNVIKDKKYLNVNAHCQLAWITVKNNGA